MQSRATKTTQTTYDLPTLIAISTLAYLVAVCLHEHLGHTTACYLLGSRAKEVGAFYVNCDYTGMSELSVRLVALAGPAVSLMLGTVCFSVLHYRKIRSSSAYYFIWLLGSIGLMSATGYLLFSGISGIGDFGTARDGVFYLASPEWLYRIALTLAGILSYIWIIHIAAIEIDNHLGGNGKARIRSARMLALTSYSTGAAIYIMIGLLNPHGLIIVAISAAASSLGATSGLLWMMQLLDRDKRKTVPGLSIKRNWSWIVVGVVSTMIYAIILGPTIRP